MYSRAPKARSRSAALDPKVDIGAARTQRRVLRIVAEANQCPRVAAQCAAEPGDIGRREMIVLMGKRH